MATVTDRTQADDRDVEPAGGGDEPRGFARYRWALTPKWVLLHVLVFLAVCGFVYAGLWQLSRLQGRREANELIRAREVAPATPIEQVLGADAPEDVVNQATFRRVTVTGTYRPDLQVLIRNRTNQSAPGYHVVTPLQLPDGTAVAVNRGWIPLLLGDAPTATAYAPPAGTVTVTGLVLETQRQEGLGVVDPADGTLATLSRVDVPRLQQQVPVRLLSAYVQLLEQAPPPTKINDEPIPDPLPPPELDDGPHVNYLGQWFIFATLTCIVYPLFLRRTAKTKADEARHERAAARAARDADAAPDTDAGADDAVADAGMGAG